jgi:hypothetical protein
MGDGNYALATVMRRFGIMTKSFSLYVGMT